MLELIDAREVTTSTHLSRPQPVASKAGVERDVAAIVNDVASRGDAAILEYSASLDGVKLSASELRVDPELIKKSTSLVRPELVEALRFMRDRLKTTCERQMPSPWMERSPGAFVGELIRPVRRAGVYVPGGRAAYPSTVIMGTTPALVAGVEGIAICSPPSVSGDIPEPVLAACAIAGVDEVYKVGGAQAIAALAFGTDSIRPVDKIVGPGNIYVTVAKRLVRERVGTDSDAGPTEIVIVADESADPRAIAADLVSQAEHGPLGSHVLISWSPQLVERVLAVIELEVSGHRDPEGLENALIEGGSAVLVRDIDQAMEVANNFAPEHLELIFEGATDAIERVHSAGAVFVGPFTPVASGDYVAGTNHVLPTGGSARWSSGLGPQDFLKRIYVCSLEEEALRRFAPHVDALAEAETLHAHARSVHARFADGARGGTS